MSETKSSKKPIIDMPSKKQLEKFVAPTGEVPVEGLEDKIKKLMDFFDNYGIDYSKFKPEFIDYITDKKAYPNFDQYMYIPGRHDMKKWLLAVKDITYKQRAGFGYKEAIRQATTNWPKMEIYDFLNWLRFYQEGTPMKYKFAQVWYENGQPGYFLHIKPDPVPEPVPLVDDHAVNDAREEAEKKEEKKQTIEKQRQKIIGRLDSAEKLLRSPEGQMFAGDELENLMEAIYSLKKKVQLVNKLSVSTRLYEDMIVREANILTRRGFVKAAEILYSVAQTPGASAEGAQGTDSSQNLIPPASPPADPSGAGQSGTISGLPATIPGTPSIETPVDGDQNKDQPPAGALSGGGGAPPTTVSSPAIIPQGKPQPKGIKEFLENLDQGNKTEESDTDDDLEVEDSLEVDDPEEMLMVTEAQAAPPTPPGVPPAALEDVPMTDTPPPERNPPTFTPTVEPEPKTPKSPATPDVEEPLEVTEDDITKDQVTPPTTSFDSRMDELMSGVSVADIVAELESISKEYKTREQPRRLAYVDMMLDSLGLASMFPSLSEAQNKALEATNYISTRVDDILAKLRGAMASQETGPAAPPAERPEVTGIKNKLESDAEKEKQRKQMRKEQEAAALEGAGKKETPQVEMGELGAPAAAVGPAPRPVG